MYTSGNAASDLGAKQPRDRYTRHTRYAARRRDTYTFFGSLSLRTGRHALYGGAKQQCSDEK